MNELLAWLAGRGCVAFWTAMIFGSILWYALLLVFVGWRGGREIRQMANTLAQDADPAVHDARRK
ncbi:MAG: hypothetical protein JW719_04040 [Pirellulales bacterium]|nr:hypothetical protein [Pirellulales bacterium]